MQHALLHLCDNYEALLCYALMHLATTLCMLPINCKAAKFFCWWECVLILFRFWMWTCTILKTRLQTCWNMTATWCSYRESSLTGETEAQETSHMVGDCVPKCLVVRFFWMWMIVLFRWYIYQCWTNSPWPWQYESLPNYLQKHKLTSKVVSQARLSNKC